MWPSGFGLDSFCCFAGWILFSSSLGEIFASLVGRLSGKTLLGKKPFLGDLVPGKPLVVLGKTCPLFGAHRGRLPFLAVCSLPILGRFLRRKNPFGKKPLSCWEKLSLWRVLALLASCSLPVFGRFLRLQSMVIRKNPFWGKNLYIVRKTHGSFGRKPLSGGLSVSSLVLVRVVGLFCVFSPPLIQEKTLLGEKKPLGKTPYLFRGNLF